MKHEDVTKFPFPPQGVKLGSFHDLSLDRENRVHCIGDMSCAANVEAVDFDTFTSSAYQPLWSKTGKLPSSVDALYLHHDTLYAVEFKAGDANNLNLIRKVYDTVMCLTEHGAPGFNYVWARNHMKYVVVCSREDVKKSIDRDRVKKRVPRWKGSCSPCGKFGNLAALEGVIVSEVLVQTPRQFENLVLEKKWA